MFKNFLLFLFVCFFSFSEAQTDSASVKQNQQKDTLAKSNKKKIDVNSPPELGEVFKPKISLGIGMLSFHGDLYSKHFQAPSTSKIGVDLNISQRLSRSLQLNFNVLFGKLGANEWRDNRQENFQAEIRSGGLSLLYDFANFIPEQCRVRPWVSLGINSFEFLSKTDRYDGKGNEYFYWSDGSIKNIAEGAPTASLAINLNRDYIYETDIRESNKDGFGKYQERAWAFPIGVGALMKISDRIDLKLGVQYYLTTTDYIDGITNKSIGTRAGTKQRDNFVYSSFALQYDLVINRKSKTDTMPEGYYDSVDFLVVDNADSDGDGVRDLDDHCNGTPKGVIVNWLGCPLDEDRDGVPNYKDDELTTPEGMNVNSKGVSLNDAYWKDWYAQYLDSGNKASNIEIVENFYQHKNDSALAAEFIRKNKTKSKSKTNYDFTVKLTKYTGPVPSDEMTYLLSIGDVKSTVLSDNSTIYTAGNYKDIDNAIKRRDEFRSEGNSGAQIGYYKDGNFIEIPDDQVVAFINEQFAGNDELNKNGSSDEVDSDANQFAKGDIVFRVQLGAYANRISKEVFKSAGNVLELMTGDNVYRYATKGYRTIQQAANIRADLVLDGYGDAFITAYKDGKRIPISQTKATMATKEKENIAEIPKFSSIDKNQITFKIQLGSLVKAGNKNMDEKTKDISDVEKQSTISGMIRYTSGSFSDYKKAEAYKNKLAEEGFVEAFVIAVFKGEVISIQEAQELLK
ncbi:MAG: hypothetical protein ACK504_03370 [Bacteroidota bacterium]